MTLLNKTGSWYNVPSLLLLKSLLSTIISAITLYLSLKMQNFYSIGRELGENRFAKFDSYKKTNSLLYIV